MLGGVAAGSGSGQDGGGEEKTGRDALEQSGRSHGVDSRVWGCAWDDQFSESDDWNDGEEKPAYNKYIVQVTLRVQVSSMATVIRAGGWWRKLTSSGWSSGTSLTCEALGFFLYTVHFVVRQG